MASFWEKARAVNPNAGPPRPPAPQGQPPAWQPVQPPPPQQQQQANPMQGLAVRDYRGSDNGIADHIATNGFYKKSPEWMKKQATDTCPNCGGVDFALVGDSGYGSKAHYGGKDTPYQEVQLARCFDCGFSSDRAMSESQIWNTTQMPSGPQMGATRQVHGAKNILPPIEGSL